MRRTAAAFVVLCIVFAAAAPWLAPNDPMTMVAAVVALLGACSTAPEQQTRSPQASKELADALAGRVAGPPQRCITTYRTTKVQPIDDFTILYDQASTIYVQNPRGGCPG